MVKGEYSLKKKIVIVISSVIALFFLLGIIEVSGLFRNTKGKIVEITPGRGISAISYKLKENGIIGSRFIFVVYSKLTGATYHSGAHVFESGSYFSVAEELSRPAKPRTVTLTIPEGYEQREIAQLLEKNGLVSAKEFNAAAKTENFDYWFLKGIKKRAMELEGYLFPDTYEFSYEETAEDIIKKMLDNFESKFTDDMKKRTNQLGLTVDQLITMASVVEREAASKDELALVAGVFYNRLDASRESAGFLQSCATVQYILLERKTVLSLADTQIKSDYNTYQNKGLPVGPIASPGLNCINAALYPKDTEYLYFAADGNGKHYFAKTLEGHQENMKKAGLM